MHTRKMPTPAPLLGVHDVATGRCHSFAPIQEPLEQGNDNGMICVRMFRFLSTLDSIDVKYD